MRLTMLQSVLHLLIILPLVFSSPLPKVITRYHTAQAVTTTQEHTTGTTTIQLPPVFILVSNGVRYTSTMSQSAATSPTTITSVISDATTSSDPDTDTKSVKDDTSLATTSLKTTTKVAPVAQATGDSNNNDTSDDKTTPKVTSTAPSDNDTSDDKTTSKKTTSTTQSDNDSTPKTTSNDSPKATEAQISISISIGNDGTSTTEIATSTTDEATSSISGVTSETDAIKAPHAIVYSPYTDDGSCKSPDTISSDLEYINSKGISHIRIYGTDCYTFTAILPKASDLGIKVNQGLWISSSGVDSIDSAVQDLIDYGKSNGFDVFDFITVGNEAVNDGFASVSDLISKISSVKSSLGDAGYSGQITTAEPPVSFINNPSLCTDSDIDFVSINPHSYFDTSIDASQAGTFVVGQQKLTKAACNSKSVIISETGYPSKGDTNGLNVPNAANQEKAIKSIIDETDGDVTILTTFNDYWKELGDYGIEPYFGAITLFS